MPKCARCNADEAMVFSCKYCGGHFCAEHRIPEMHACDMVKAYEPVTVLRETKKLEYQPARAARLRLNLPGMSFSLREFRDIIIAILLFILAIVSYYRPRVMTDSWLTNIYVGATLGFGACLAFLVHELAHKFMATYHGSKAEFRLHPVGVAVTAISALAGALVIVPGAVNITGHMPDKETLGKVALVGPLSNIVMALIARMFAWNDLVLINLVFALVNLIPLYVLDGRKVFYWSKLVWFVSFMFVLAISASWFIPHSLP